MFGVCIVLVVGKLFFILVENEMEFGVGIYGEFGIEWWLFILLNDMVDVMFDILIEYGYYKCKLCYWDR